MGVGDEPRSHVARQRSMEGTAAVVEVREVARAGHVGCVCVTIKLWALKFELYVIFIHHEIFFSLISSI